MNRRWQAPLGILVLGLVAAAPLWGQEPPAPPPLPQPVSLPSAGGVPPGLELPARLDARRASVPLPDPSLVVPDSLDRVESVFARAEQRYAGIHSYIVRFKRREMIGEQALPEDNLLFKFRKEPFSIYMKSLEGSPTTGRELLYVRGRFNNQWQVRAGRFDILPGMRWEMDLSSPRATMNSRRTLDEAGFGNMIGRFGKAIAAMKEGSQPTVTLGYIGSQARPETPQSLECVLQTLAPGKEKHLPQGGRRYWFFANEPKAAEYALPVLIVTLDDQDREVEYYFSDRICVNVNLGDRDFDPDLLWGN
ncbi:MAG TPA: DUF1571 domain-containing protein [Gemmatales bacterium]|nr:DUF1571 domain-containing protein [Gemmatales bacterium]